MLLYNRQSLPTNHELVTVYHDTLQKNISSDRYRPIILPYDGLGVLILITYLCIPHVNRPWLYALRWPVAALIVAFYSDVIRNTRSSFMGSGFGVGLLAGWLIVWTLTWLLFNNPQRDAKRVERVQKKRSVVNSGEVNGATRSSEKPSNGEANGSLTHRRQQNGIAGVVNVADGSSSSKSEFFWQSYPMDDIWARVNWVQDLVYNCRGPGWNWELSSNPGLPPHVLTSLGEAPSSAKSVSRVGIRRYKTRSELARHVLPKVLLNYFFLDFLKVLLMTDGYFLLGPLGTAIHTPAFLAHLPVWIHPIIRQLLSGIAIIIALETVLPLGSVFLCLIMGPKILGLRGEAWMYPSTWGSFSIIFEKGLNGLWSGWWHQTFRHAFISPTQYLIRRGILAPKATSTKLVGLVVAFSISGFLHACGSYTQIANTIPWHPIIFFLLQVVGILLQTTICTLLHPQIKQLPMRLRHAGNFVFALVWMVTTSPFLTDDFARGGIWLFEPVPISPLRALGYGNKDDSWWCWDLSGVSWYASDKWWMNGVGF